MKLLNILEKLGDTNFDITETQSQSRRESLFSIGKSGKSLLQVALPLGIIAALPTEAKAGGGGKSSASIIDVLNFALKLEYLESSFYSQGLASTVIPTADQSIFNQISKHETQHVAFLKSTITTLGGTPIASPSFDFTAKGKFKPFFQYGDFLALAQAFEDTGVRAYKGQAGNLITNDTVLQAALQIHSVEARHASEVRRLRAKNGMDVNNKGWITGNSRGTLPTETQATYNGENNTIQSGLDVSGITSVGVNAVTEAFDEPLTDTDVLAIAGLFIV